MTIKSEKIFFSLMVIMAIVLLFSLSSCAILDKMRIPTNVPDVFITTPIVNPTSTLEVSDENNI